jgi:hypothetical protein
MVIHVVAPKTSLKVGSPIAAPETWCAIGVIRIFRARRDVGQEEVMTTHTIARFIGRHYLAAVAASVLLAAVPGKAWAQPFVTGSANTDGFSIVGTLRAVGAGWAGQFTIILHRDIVDGTTVAAVCQYRNFDRVVIRLNLASFHSIGECEALTSAGGRARFISDNVFGIQDNGQPGAGNDTVDVNLISGTGLTIPGSFLVDGNFLVRP